MIGILNYGVGNIRAFFKAYSILNIPVRVISSADEIKEVEKLILPGVGAFDSVIEKINKSGLLDILKYEVLEKKKPILGVCVGMQILARKSEEGNQKGLNWISGDVKKIHFPNNKSNLPIPQIGWNEVYPKNENPLFDGIKENARFYFLHSYVFEEDDKKNSISESNYGGLFTSAIHSENIYATQFHPEKSHGNGLKVLENFYKLC